MAVTVDEVTADVSPRDTGARATPCAQPQAKQQLPCADRRHLREQLDYIHERAARVKAD